VRKTAKVFLPVILVIVALDQASKLVIARAVGFHEVIPVIKGYVDIVHVRNRGIAFGIFNRPDSNFGTYVLIAMTCVAVLLLSFWLLRMERENPKLGIPLSLIIGGALGNLIDRVRLLEVVDFLSVHAAGFYWPAFNVADSAITVGTILLAVLLLKEGNWKEA